MNTKSIVQLIATITNLKQIDFQPQNKLNLDLISRKQDCNLCQTYANNIKYLTSFANQSCNQYNKLLNQSQKLIDLYYQLFQQQHTQFQQTAIQLQKENLQFEQRIKQLQQIIEENTKTILQYRNLLLEKDEILAQYQERYQKNIQQKQLGSPIQDMQNVKFHKREKSQLCNRLENIDISLLSDHKKYKEENKYLIQHVNELNDYVKRMEQDLANNNIKSPKIIHELSQFVEVPNPNKFDRILEEFDKSSAKQYNKSFSQMQSQEPFFQRNSLRSSFAPNGRRPLRDILNISGQTSNYFNLRTKQKFQQPYANTLQNNISNENNQNFNSVNLIKNEVNTSFNKIMEIKQFEINQTLKADNYKDKIPKKQEIRQSSKSIKKGNSFLQNGIDPYHTFFTLTIQCLKLNWRSLDEVANLCLADQWQKILQQQIPINKWNDYLKEVMISKIKQMN